MTETTGIGTVMHIISKLTVAPVKNTQPVTRSNPL